MTGAGVGPRLLVVLPDGVDDPQRPSGGNIYDRRLCDGLRSAGWSVQEHTVPVPAGPLGGAGGTALAATLRGAPAGTPVLVDGLLASPAPAAVLPAARRVPVTVLVHLPLGVGGTPTGTADDADDIAAHERQVLAAAAAVVVTSPWCREWLLEHYALAPDRVSVAVPGVERAPPAPGTSAGTDLLCVGTLAPHKGYDVLLAALARVRDLRWRCTWVGDTGRDPAYVARLVDGLTGSGLAPRVRLTGALGPGAVAAAYAAADLVALPSRLETYGMVLTEALARGVPVLATRVGGVPGAVGRAPDGTVPGLLVPPDDPGALAEALRAWCSDAALRGRLRRAAGERRESLPRWADTVAAVARALAATVAGPVTARPGSA